MGNASGGDANYPNKIWIVLANEEYIPQVRIPNYAEFIYNSSFLFF